MNKEVNGELLSDFEIILPWDVIETCCNLKPNESSCFVSENQLSQTNNQLYISKLEDNSIKVRITVTSLKMPLENGTCLPANEGPTLISQAINNEESNRNENNENLSTIIIVKSNSPTKALYSEPIKTHSNISVIEQSNKMNGQRDNNNDKKQPVVKYKKDKPPVKTIKSPPPFSSPKKESECVVQCELCGDAVVGYGPLYKHVRWAHGEGTFVQNYLDELKPLVKSWAVEQHKKSQYRQKEFFSSLDFVDPSIKVNETSNKGDRSGKEPPNKKRKIVTQEFPSTPAPTSAPHPPPAKIYHCKSCGSQLLTMLAKLEHETKCRSILQFVCDFCVQKKKFSTMKSMLRHVRELHVGKRATPHMLQGVICTIKKHSSRKSGSEHEKSPPSLISVKNTKSKKTEGAKDTLKNVDIPATSSKTENSCDLCHEEFASLNLLVCHAKYCRSFPQT